MSAPFGGGGPPQAVVGAHNNVHAKESKTPAASKKHASEYDKNRPRGRTKIGASTVLEKAGAFAGGIDAGVYFG